MRLRKKPWARPELDAWKSFINQPEEYKGCWNKYFENNNPIHMELGCGKGGFICQLAPHNLDINYIAIDIKDEVLGLAKRKLEGEYKKINAEPKNIALMAQDIERIHMILAPEDKIERIYINFCNPWTQKERHEKHRLTHSKQLALYKEFLHKDGAIHFKTDSDVLFEDSLLYFKESGFEVTYITYDLHSSGYEFNIETEHETMYAQEGIKIKFCIAKLK